jgi:hypothetical protein
LNERFATQFWRIAFKVDQYDLESNTWAPHFPSLTQFRVAHGVTTRDSKICVMGGSSKASKDFGPGLNQMEVLTFDEEGNVETKWEVESSMLERRSYLASCCGSGGRRIYTVAGDLNEDGSTAEVYDVEGKRWVQMAQTLTKRDSLGLVNLDGEDQIYAVGGYNNLDNRGEIYQLNKFIRCIFWDFAKRHNLDRTLQFLM